MGSRLKGKLLLRNRPRRVAALWTLPFVACAWMLAGTERGVCAYWNRGGRGGWKSPGVFKALPELPTKTRCTCFHGC
eukprot:scaffold10630_cov16-Tisochrysis_lutea.AAC.1